MNILCGLDDAYLQHCSVMLTSLFCNTPGKGFRVFVVHDGLSDFSQRQLRRVCKRYGHELILVQAQHASLTGLPIKVEHISVASYYRLMVAHLLPTDLDRVLYLDSDLVVRSDLRPFYEQDMGDCFVSAIAEVPIEGRKKRLGMQPQERYYNSGVMLMNLPVWREEQFGEQALQFAVEKSHMMRQQDQDAINAVSNGRALICAPKWNAGGWVYVDDAPPIPGATDEDLREARQDPAIAHFTGSNKPWIGGMEHPFAHEYFYYLKKTPHFGREHLKNRLRTRAWAILGRRSAS